MTRQVEFFYDVISPTAYLAWSQLPALIKRTEAELVCRPFFLGGVMKATDNRPPGAVAAKGKWMMADMGRFAGLYGVPLNPNPNFPMMNTLPIQRASIAMKGRSDFQTFLDAMFAAVWRDQRNVGDRTELSEIVTTAGFNADEFWSMADAEENKEAVKANTDEAVARGAFGAPTFFVGDEMHFGQDRLSFVEAALLA